MSLFYRRTFWLLVIGLAHAYLLWDGDILVPYALCGLVVVTARRWRAAVQATVGGLMLAVPTAQELYYALTAPTTSFGAWDPGDAAIRAELAAYRGGWLEQLPYRASESFEAQTAGFLAWSFWRLGGLMLVGMALYRWGVLTNDRPRRFYRRLVVVGGGVGLVVIASGIVYITAHDWAVEAALFYRQFNYWGSVLLAGAYVGAVMLYCARRADGLLARSLAAVGRTAFSNYLLQTVLATSIFYGYGLGLFGHLSRVELLGVVVLVWAIQVPLSVWWLRRYRFGPVEWLWRTLTYGERQPLRNSD